MKQSLLISCILIACLNNVSAQEAVVAFDKINVAYEGVDNPLTIAVEHCPCKDITLTTENGTLTSDGPCHYNWKPARAGKALLAISKRTGNGSEQIDNVSYRVKPLPLPEVRINRKFYVMERQAALSLLCDGFDFAVQFKILDFKIEFLRNGELIYSAKNKGDILDAETRASAGKLYPQDIVRITDIHYQGPDNITRIIDQGIHRTMESISTLQW